jgi:catechol-2,3-dioxygenase
MLKISSIKETCLYVKDLQQTKDFYHGLLNLPVINYVENKFIFFRAGSSVLLCFNPEESKKQQNLPSHFAEGQIHFAFEVKKEDYASWKDHLTNNNVKILHEET